MSDLKKLLDRNRRFATGYQGGLSLPPCLSTVVLACIDARVDPAHVLGLELGDAFVFRSAGARVTEDIEVALGVLWELSRERDGDRFSGFELAIFQHTDCAMERLSDPALRRVLGRRLAAGQGQLEELGIADHGDSIRADIERLRRSPRVPKALVVSGFLYDVADGVVRQLAAPTPLG